MASHHRPARRLPSGARPWRAATIGTLTAGLIGAALLVPAIPAYASTPTDLSVKLTNAVDAVPGKRVSYLVVVHNNGPKTAQRVQVDFTTTTSMKSVEYKIKNGHCYRSPRETACIFYSGLKKDASASVTISGVISKKLKKGTPVHNRVTLTAGTRLTHTTDDAATDDYRIGIPRVVATPTPAPTPTKPQSKITQIHDAAESVFGFGHSALVATWAAVGATVLWFGLGLTLRRRHRRQERWVDDADPSDA